MIFKGKDGLQDDIYAHAEIGLTPARIPMPRLIDYKLGIKNNSSLCGVATDLSQIYWADT